MSTALIERLIITALVVACLSPCIPVAAKAWNRREEKRILRPPRCSSPRDMAKFYKGCLPHHEDCSLLSREEAEFACVVAGYDYQAASEPDYRRQP